MAEAAAGAPAGGGTETSTGGGSSAPASGGSSMPAASGQKSGQKSGQSDPNDAKPETKTEAAAKLKAKWRGADHEAEPAELRRMLSDDYEHEFKVGERSVKKKWGDIQRSVQLSEGAMDRMREASEREKAVQDAIAWGSKNVPEFLQAHLGVANFDDFVMEHGQKMWQRIQELEALAKTNPVEYHNRVMKDAEQRADQKRAWERQQAQTAQQAREQNEARARAEQAVGGALQNLGVRPSKENIARAEQIFREHAEVGYKLSLEDLAALTKEAYRKSVLDELDAHDGETLLELLGEERRAKLREMEVERAKGKKQEERQAAKDERKDERQRAPAADPRTPKGISEKDFNRKFRAFG